MSNLEKNHLSSRLSLFDYKYVSITDTKKALLYKDGLMDALLSFVYPSIFVAEIDYDKWTKQNRIELVKETIAKITEHSFIKSIFKNTPLSSINEPFVLMKIGKSRKESNLVGDVRSKSVDDFICIPIEESIIRFVDELTDDILILAHDVNANCSLYAEKPLVIKGFVKTLMDFALYQASEVITKITIDLIKCEIRFGGIIPDVSVPARELSMYVLVAVLSKITIGLNKNPKRGEQLNSYCKLFQLLGDLTMLSDTNLKLESKYITSNISKLLCANTLIRDVSKLVPSKGSDYAIIDERVLNSIEIRFRNSSYEVKKMNLSKFWTEYLEPYFPQKKAAFDENQ